VTPSSLKEFTTLTLSSTILLFIICFTLISDGSFPLLFVTNMKYVLDQFRSSLFKKHQSNKGLIFSRKRFIKILGSWSASYSVVSSANIYVFKRVNVFKRVKNAFSNAFFKNSGRYIHHFVRNLISFKSLFSFFRGPHSFAFIHTHSNTDDEKYFKIFVLFFGMTQLFWFLIFTELNNLWFFVFQKKLNGAPF